MDLHEIEGLMFLSIPKFLLTLKLESNPRIEEDKIECDEGMCWYLLDLSQVRSNLLISKEVNIFQHTRCRIIEITWLVLATSLQIRLMEVSFYMLIFDI